MCHATWQHQARVHSGIDVEVGSPDSKVGPGHAKGLCQHPRRQADPEEVPAADGNGGPARAMLLPRPPLLS